MSVTLSQRVRNKVRGVLLEHGPTTIKKSLWNAEFAEGRWNKLDETHGDCIYPFLEHYGKDGSILDLGCGSGNTGAELDANAYHDYTGVDISDVAVEKATKKAEHEGRSEQNRYFASDISSYEPVQQFDVILFRDSIYYIPGPQHKGMLDRYSKFLKEDGVFIVRLWTGRGKQRRIVNFVESEFKIVEKYVTGPHDTVVLVFRPANGR